MPAARDLPHETAARRLRPAARSIHGDSAPMKTVHRTPSFTLTHGNAAELERDFILIPLFESDDLSDAGAAELAGPDLEQARRRGELTGKLYEVFLSAAPSGSRARRIAFVGAGARKDFTADR